VDLTTRDGRLEDAAAIAALLTQLGYPCDESAVEARIDRLQIVGDRIVVAEVEGKVAGVAHLQVTPALERDAPVARIGALVVDDAHRTRGSDVRSSRQQRQKPACAAASCSI
jgi:N-acetylglutamate synthase-like GNAT family acetyltransferase